MFKKNTIKKNILVVSEITAIKQTFQLVYVNRWTGKTKIKVFISVRNNFSNLVIPTLVCSSNRSTESLNKKSFITKVIDVNPVEVIFVFKFSL